MFSKVWRLPAGRFALILMTVILLLAIFGQWLAPYDPLDGAYDPLTGPGPAHWLGTDYMGRDVLSRLLHGATLSIFSALQVALIGLLVGAIPGILSVYLGRAFEWASLRLVDTLIAIPFLIFAVAVTALLGNGLTEAMAVVGVLVSPLFFRVARAATLAVSRSQYVEAAVLAGASLGWVIRKHVWEKILPPLAISLATTMGYGLVVVASLTFLGIGVQPPEPTWGGDLAADLQYLHYKPYAPLYPSLLIMATVWGLNLLADAIRDVSGESGRVLGPAKKPASAPRQPEVTK